MMRQRRQLYALGNVLSRRFYMCSIEVNNTLFRSFCTPMNTCQLWWNFSVQSMHKLNVAYNNAFRFMHHLPTYCSASLMFVVNRVPNRRAVIRNRIYGFMKRLVSSSNALVLSAVYYYYYYHHFLNRPTYMLVHKRQIVLGPMTLIKNQHFGEWGH